MPGGPEVVFFSGFFARAREVEGLAFAVGSGAGGFGFLEVEAGVFQGGFDYGERIRLPVAFAAEADDEARSRGADPADVSPHLPEVGGEGVRA